MRLEIRRMSTGRPIQCLVADDLPIGDFDQIQPPDSAPRLYRTQGGWRVFYTDRGFGAQGQLMHDLILAGCDPRYILYVSLHGFAVRVSPKRDVPEPWCVARLVHQQGEIHSDWQEFISEHDRLTRANMDGVLC
jgi:hypothetical protein